MAAFVIVGAGGLAREAAAMLLTNNQAVYGFIGLPDEIGQTLNGYPVIGSDGDLDRFNRSQLPMLLALGAPQVKRRLISRLELQNWPIFVDKRATVIDVNSVGLGKGVFIAAGAILTCNIQIERMTYVNLNVTIGHDCHIGECCQINPGANISGGVTIGNNVMIGTGAQILERLTIGDNAIVGAGAVVTRDVPAGATVVGVPAKRVK